MHCKKVGIILKKNSQQARVAADEMVDWFQRRSIATVIDAITPELDILIILGGDGTLLHVAEEASQCGVPVVGINMGNLGFLTEVSEGEKFQALDAILTGSAVIEDRIMLKARLQSDGKSGKWRYALNDVVISKGAIDRLVRLCTWVDAEYLNTYKADGLIFSTPTGSTAYNLSAGGPIVHPGLAAIVVTPICPFMLESRPVLLPSPVHLSTRLAGRAADVKVILDGQLAWNMDETDNLEVAASEKPLRLICSPQKGYFDILRCKLNWGGPVDNTV
ncbi:MAG: NAD(+)/NADH kinase [Deltaproteobacteria bacterium]|nr:NAD(+)/NADH kinase [Deltaproteobacteria bacterium]